MKKFPNAKLYNGLIRYECRNGLGINNPKVISHLHELDLIPLKLQEVIVAGGLDIIFFNGQLTDNWELRKSKGKKPRGWEKGDIWDKVPGGVAGVRVYIGINGDYYWTPEGKDNIFLHEFGHGFDKIVGKRFYHKPISREPIIRQAVKEEPFKGDGEDYFHYPLEYVAESVDWFYSNYHSRRKLRENQPTIFEFLSEINNRCK